MHVGVLGPLTVRRDGPDVALRGQRLRDLLAVLLQRRGRPVPAEVLLDLVWAHRAGTLTVAAVHTVVARLRRQLGADSITSQDAGYLLDARVSTDEDIFVDLVGRARGLLVTGEPAGAAKRFREALRCWHGDEAFEDVRSDLVDTDRARLAELRATAIEELADLLLTDPHIGDPAAAYLLGTGLIARQPLREKAYQLTMVAAAQCHRQADAVHTYQALRRQLRDELGIEPSRSSAELYTMILQQDLRPPTAAPLPPLSPAGMATSVPPAPVSPLIGRDDELARLVDAVVTGRRLITIIGPGGVGKSRLMIELGARLAGSKELLYTELSGLTQIGPGELAEAIAVGLGIRLTRQEPVDALVQALATGNRLLLLDEAEWVIDAVGSVAGEILDRCSGVQIVITSRLPVDLQDEALVVLDPLGLPEDGATHDDIRSAPAVQFLVRRLADRAVLVGSDAASADLRASIAGRVDGLPLALELAAGQATGRSLAELAELVQAPLDVPAAQRTRNARHRTLRDTLEWSMTRLEPGHRRVLRRLAVFAGRFDMAAAIAIVGPAADDPGSAVRALARDALIHVDRTSSSRLTFRLLRTVRELALEDMQPDELAATQALHRRWHADLWRSTGDELIPDVRAHLDDYLDALRSALANDDAATLADLTVTLTEFWRFAGGQATGLRWIGTVLDSNILGAADRARVMAQRAALALNHDPQLVLADTAAAIPLLESTGHSAFTVTAVSVRALELLAQGRLTEAIDHAGHAVQIARSRTADQLANALGDQAVIYAVVGVPDRAAAAIDEAVGCLRGRAVTPEGVVAAGAIALALVNLERFQDAVDLLDGVDIPPAASPPPARFRLNLGWACLGAGHFSRALGCFLDAIPPPTRTTADQGSIDRHDADRHDADRRPADRHGAETLLGAGCTLAAIGHEYAAPALAGALELLTRVDYRSPPALERAIARARAQVDHRPWPQVADEPTGDLMERLERDMRALGAGSADSRSAAG